MWPTFPVTSFLKPVWTKVFFLWCSVSSNYNSYAVFNFIPFTLNSAKHVSGWVWSAILLVGDPVKKNRQSANKKFPAQTPLSPYDPTNREACHFRIIPKSFTYKN